MTRLLADARIRFGIGLAVLLTSAPSTAQINVSTGLVFGGAVDNRGRALGGVSVEARNPTTGFVRRSVTVADGGYRIDLLPPGRYDLQASLEGFRTELQQDVPVGLGGRVIVDFILTASVVEEELVVTATVPVVDTADHKVGSTVGSWAIGNLPLRGRNFTDLALLTSGSATDRFAETQVRGGRNSVYLGARQIQNSFNIDGGSDNSVFFGRQRGGTLPPFTFSQAAIREFQVLKTAYGLQYSAGGGVINAITKSGTNELHGEIFGYFTNDDMVATDALGRSEDWSQLQGGFALGGPVVRDRVHFFGSLDAQDWQVPHHTVFVDFPTSREADWETLTGLDYDVETSAYPATNDAIALLLKLDWRLSVSHLLTARYNRSDTDAGNQAQPIQFESVGRSNNGTASSTVNSVVVSLNSVLSDRLVNEAHVQLASESRPTNPNFTGLPATEVFPNRALWGQSATLPNDLDENSLQLVDTVRAFYGRHHLKAGIDLEFLRFDNRFCRFCRGLYSFEDWEGVGGFLDQGTPFVYLQAFSDTAGRVVFDGSMHSLFVEDEWLANPHLSLTYGLRYEVQRRDQPTVTNPLYPATGHIPTDTDNWSLRGSFAWDVKGDGRQVLRGGVGRYYDTVPTVLDANAMLVNGITVVQLTQFCAFGASCPTYPDVWTSAGDLEDLPPDIFVFDSAFENPETDRVSLGYERQLGRHLSLALDVVYSETRKLERKQDQNIVASDGSTTPDGRTLYGGCCTDPNFNRIVQFTSDARARYSAAVLRGHKRFSNGWFLEVSYTWSDARDNDSNERSVSTSSNFPEDQYDLDNDWGPSNFDVRHKLVASLVWQLPLDLQLGVIGVYRTGFPYSALDARDNNNDTYRNERALVETSPGVWSHADRNAERQPSVTNVDLRLSWTADLGWGLGLELMGEVFNVTNEANWYVAGANRVLVERDGSINEDFGVANSVGPPRRFQIGARLRF
jgi:hypothetical protein